MVRGATRPTTIPRPRLYGPIAAAAVTVLEAPGGYGKSTLCAQLADALDRPCVIATVPRALDLSGMLSSLSVAFRRTGFAGLAATIDPDDAIASVHRLSDRLQQAEGLILAVDEVQRISPAARQWLAELSELLTPSARFVVAGRRVGVELAALLDRPDAVAFDPQELCFDDEELGAVLALGTGKPVPAEEIAEVMAATGGWPAAAILMARSRGRHRNEGSSVLRNLVDGLMKATDDDTRDAVRRLAGVPLLSAEVTAVVGGDRALDRLLDAGLPIHFRPDGWGVVPDSVRALLPAEPSLTYDEARHIADIYARADELEEGLALLHRIDDHEGVAALLAVQHHEALQRVGLLFLDTVLAATPDAVLAQHSDALAGLVRAAENTPRLRTAWLARAADVVPEDTPARRAIDAERALTQGRMGDLTGAIALANSVLDAAAAAEVVTRGRALFARALCTVVADSVGSTATVADDLNTAGSLFRLAGERTWDPVTHRSLGYGCHFTAGAFDLAIEHLDRALALNPAPNADRADTLTYVGEVLTHVGRLDDAAVALREAEAIGRRLGDDKTIAYAAWSAAELACQRRDRAAADAAIDRAERHPDGWFDRLAGIDFLAHAADIRMILGDRDGARVMLERAEGRAKGTERADQPKLARARFEAMYGDPAQALALVDALADNPTVFRRDRWLRLLLRAVCLARLGQAQEAAALVHESRRAAEDIGDPDRPDRREPELLALALPSAIPTTTPASTIVVLLGRFAVERDGVDVSPAAGRPATLVKLVALRGHLTADEAIDLLWPETDLATGRARLRNVLSRIRATCGPLLDRDDDSIALADTVEVDAQRFEKEIEKVSSAPPPERAGQARRALARYTGELLPADLFADWAAAPRERIRRKYLGLVDVIADAAMADGDLDEACRLLETAITTGPLEEERYVRLARALLAQGRPRRAQRVLDQARAVATDLGVEPGAQLRQLARELDHPT
jgi:DNA-binding SARP family transcriptional activator